jgi:hypothetical protein
LEGWEIPNAPTSIPNLKSARSAATSDLVNAQVESVNIVGYQTVPLAENGFTATCATLAPIGMTDGTMTLGDIRANENFAMFEDSIQIFNAAGALVVEATYVSQEILDAEGLSDLYDAGWYALADTDMENGPIYNSYVLPFGGSMTVFSGYAGAGLLYVGEVVQSDVEIPLTEGGFTAVGNASPVDLTLGDIKANENFAMFEDSVQIFNAAGSLVVEATYVSQEILDAEGLSDLYDAGWYALADTDMENGPVYNTFAMVPGQGMTVFSGYPGAAIIIPNPMSAPAP